MQRRPQIERALILVGAALFMGAAGAIEDEPRDHPLPLPKWSSEARPPLGHGLWPDDFRPEDVVHPALGSPAGSPQISDEESWLRFLPRGLFDKKSRSAAKVPEVPLENLPEEALRAAEHAPASSHLLDPQGLVGEAQTEDIARLLAAPSERAGVEIFVLLIDRFQKLPPGADLSQLASGAVARGAKCLAIVPLGAPERARLFFTQSITAEVPASYLSGFATSCVRDALETSDPVEQFERYAMQLCLHLFWMERAYPAVKPPAVEVRRAIVEPEALLEIGQTAAGPSEESKLRVFWREWRRPLALGLAGLIALVYAAVLVLRWHRRRSRQFVWILPDYDHKHATRFGGEHCGGCGASLKYG